MPLGILGNLGGIVYLPNLFIFLLLYKVGLHSLHILENPYILWIFS